MKSQACLRKVCFGFPGRHRERPVLKIVASSMGTKEPATTGRYRVGQLERPIPVRSKTLHEFRQQSPPDLSFQ